MTEILAWKLVSMNKFLAHNSFLWNYLRPSTVMTPQEFAAWRQRVDLTQEKVAEIFGVRRPTVQNWESGQSQISPAVATHCEVWERRLKQENPVLGPVTLVYSNAPMFVNPNGPVRAPAQMVQEIYHTNAQVLARVESLWGAVGFCNPFVLSESSTLWSINDLSRVVDGLDTRGIAGAPTLQNMIRYVATHARETASFYVRKGPKSTSQAEHEARLKAIDDVATALDELAAEPRAMITAARFEALRQRLVELGMRPHDSYVSGIASVFAMLL